MVLKNLWRRKGRTLLTLAGIAIGVAVVVALLALADGMTAQITGMAAGGGADLTLMQDGIADMSFSALGEEVGEAIAAMPEVEWVSGLLFNVLPVEQRPLFLVMGMEPQGAGIQHFRIVEGRSLQGDDEVLLGRMAAGFFDKGPDDELILQGQRYRIAGVYETGVAYEDAGAVLPLAEAQRLFKKRDQVSLYQVKVRLEAIGEVDALIEKIQERFPDVAAYRSSEFAQNAPDIKNLQTIAGAVSLIGLLAGALGTMNTMLMSVLERTREIGTLRALGWQKRQVLGLILQESLALSLAGGLVGCLLGAGLVALINLSPALKGAFVGRLGPPAFATGLIVALVLGALGGLYPAWRATRLQPIEALRYE
ncbi:MAG: ABC transporter permease [Chloroflexi bacterium]|nr:ABC transporter permease [Chloroflexota bacterium]